MRVVIGHAPVWVTNGEPEARYVQSQHFIGRTARGTPVYQVTSVKIEPGETIKIVADIVL